VHLPNLKELIVGLLPPPVYFIYSRESLATRLVPWVNKGLGINGLLESVNTDVGSTWFWKAEKGKTLAWDEVEAM
jgi:hypothetical protein